MKKHIIPAGVGIFWLILCILCWLPDDKTISNTERRKLAAFPECTVKTLQNGTFMKEFETYSQDHFPERDLFRGIKSAAVLYLFQEKENNGLYMADGFISSLDPDYHEDSVSHFTNVMQSVYEEYLKGKDCRLFYSVIPDKNVFLARPHGYPSLDTDRLQAALARELPWASNASVWDTVSVESFYRTDTHWKQESLTKTADALLAAMQPQAETEMLWKDLTFREVKDDFYGVYAGQLALPVSPDTILLAEDPVLLSCEVWNRENNQIMGLYNEEKLESRDPYEVYLSGAAPLLEITSSLSASEKELIVFRDSFGSSLIPLLAEYYRKITVVDLRYINRSILGSFVDFAGQDVLFIYSTQLINNSYSIK